MSVASEINRLNIAKASLKLKINSKNDEEHQITSETLEDYSDYVDNITAGGGSIVNSIIEQYKAESETIDANTFVEFVNHNTIGTDTQIELQSYMYNSATALSDSKVFIAYDNSNYLYGIVCTISGTTITKGNPIKLGNYSGSYKNAAAVTLDSNKVFVAHHYGDRDYLYGIVCTISGATITAGIDTRITTISSANLSAAALSDNKVFISHGSSLYGIVCTISGTTITAGIDTRISSVSYSGQHSALAALNSNKVFIVYPNDTSGYYLNGVVCTIDGTTITVGTNNEFGGYRTALNPRIVALSNNKVFIIHSASASNSKLKGIICTVDGTTITAGTDTQLSATDYSSENASIVVLNSNKVFIAHQSDQTNKYLYGIICKINNTTITAGNDIQLSSASDSGLYISATVLNPTKIFIAHHNSSNNYIYGMVTEFGDNTIQSSSTKIEGLTKDEVTTSTAGDVWVLNS